MDSTQEEQGGVAASGEALRQAREARGLRAADVAQILKLSTRQIEAIEAEAFEQLPGSTWIRGFVRNYARFLELDPAPLLARLDQGPRGADTLRLTPESNAVGAVPASPSGYRSPSAIPALAAVAVLVVVGLLAWHFDLAARLARKPEVAATPAIAASSEPVFPPASEDTAVVTAQVEVAASSPAASEVVASALVPATASSSVSASVPARPPERPAASQAVAAEATATVPAAQGGANAIVLSFQGDAWVEVRDASGKVIFSRLSKAGESQEVRGSAPYSLVVGNSHQVKLQYQGKAVALEPKAGSDVVRLSLP